MDGWHRQPQTWLVWIHYILDQYISVHYFAFFAVPFSAVIGEVSSLFELRTAYKDISMNVAVAVAWGNGAFEIQY